MTRRSWLLSVLLLSACGGGLERVAFVTDLLAYAPGGRVGLSMVNTSATPLGINLCLSQLVSEDGKTTGPADGETCVLAPQSLAPGAQFDVRKAIPAATPVGIWRYETTIRLATGSGEKVYTPAFTVAK